MKKENKEFDGFEKFVYTAFAIALVIFIGGFWVGHSLAKNRYKQDIVTVSTKEIKEETDKIYIDSYRLDKRISTGYVASYEYWIDYIKDGKLYNIQLSELKIIEGSKEKYIIVEDCDGADCHPLAAKETKHVTLYTNENSMSLYEQYDFRNILVKN